MEILSNGVTVIAICVTFLLFLLLVVKFSDKLGGLKISKNGVEFAKSEGETAAREVIREGLQDADVRLDYVTNVLNRMHPNEELFVKWVVSEMRNVIETILIFNSIEDTDEYKKFRWSTLEAKIKSVINPDWEFPFDGTYDNFCKWVSVVAKVKQIKGLK